MLTLPACCVTDVAWANSALDLIKQGDAALANAEYSKAVRMYTSAIDIDSTSAMIYTKRAAAHISMRQNSQALRDLNNALEVDPKYVQGYLNRGKLLRKTCRVDEAEQDFQKVLEMRPGQKTATSEVGFSCRRQPGVLSSTYQQCRCPYRAAAGY
jgi:tetratricopeptide (TPR) repeat protein